MLRRTTLGANATTRVLSATVQVALSAAMGTKVYPGADDVSFAAGVPLRTVAAFSSNSFNCHPRWHGRGTHELSATLPGVFPMARKSTVMREVDTEELASSGKARSKDQGGTPSKGRGNLRSFILTDIGEGIKEVEILQWFVGPGDRVRQFDKLCEVQSDKANVEISSRYDGIVRKLHHQVGDMAETGCVLVDIEEITVGHGASEPLMSSEGKGVTGTTDESPEGVQTTEDHVEAIEAMEGTQGATARRKILATPAVRRLLRELSPGADGMLGIDIVGTGPGGRVLKGDVLAYATANGISLHSEIRGETHFATGGGMSGDGGSAVAEGRRRADGGRFTAGSAGVPDLARRSTEDDLPSGTTPLSQHPKGLGVGELGSTFGADEPAADGGPLVVREERRVGRRREMKEPVAVPIRGMQRAMMETMRKALEVPHMTFCDEVIADPLIQLRTELKEAAAERGLKLSYLPFVIKVTSMALAAHPTLNASLSEDQRSLLQHPDHNIGVAMDTDKGLVVPNISRVQDRSILEITEELNTLQRLGAAGKLGEEELSGTTFTLSNIGTIAGTYTSPIILHPQVGIGALGRMQRVPRFDPGDPEKLIGVSIIPVSWSADHRVVDGGTIARFSNLWKAYLENPARMLADTR